MSEDKRHMLGAVDQLAIGSIILMWGILLMFKQIGILDENVSTWPFVLAAFGMLLISGSIYRLHSRKTT